MQDLHYATVTTERHSFVVSTWIDDGSIWCRMTVDGRTLSYAPLELGEWLECCDMPRPLHADDCPIRHWISRPDTRPGSGEFPP